MLNIKRRILVLILIIIVLICTGCQKEVKDVQVNSEEEQIVTDEDTVILDVRTLEEFNEGHIKDAILIPDYNIKDVIEYVVQDKNKKILVYCKTGVRSKKVVEELIGMGYKNVHDFGGITNYDGELFAQPSYSVDNYKFYLLGMVETEDIYLYGMDEKGIILYQNEQGTYFDWYHIAFRGDPELSYLDYDNDGNNELVIVLYIGAGTGISIKDLHILKIDKSENSNKIQYTDHSLLGTHAQWWFEKGINGKISANGKEIILDFNDKIYNVKTEYGKGLNGKVIKIDFGDVVQFYFEGTDIKTKIALGSKYEVYAAPVFFGEITATVKFDGERFSFADYEFFYDDE